MTTRYRYKNENLWEAAIVAFGIVALIAFYQFGYHNGSKANNASEPVTGSGSVIDLSPTVQAPSDSDSIISGG